MASSRALPLIARAVLAALFAALVVSIWEATAAKSDGAGFGSVLLPTFALYAIPCSLFGVFAGVFHHSWIRTFGDDALGRAYARLKTDRQAEARAVGYVFAAALVLAVVAAVSLVASLKFVAAVERKGVGALVVALATAAAVPIGLALALPVYRLGLVCSKVVPRIGPIVRPLVLVLAALLVAALGSFWIVTTKLDWRALPLGAPVAGVVFLALFSASYATAGKLLRGESERIVLVAAAVVTALAMINVPLSTSPSPEVANAIVDRSRGAGVLVRVARGRIDGDGDGVSAFFAGPDCDDSNPRVYPGAPEIPDNGIDDNCEFGDRKSAPAVAAGGNDAGATQAPAKPRPKPAKHLLFVVVDTVRADRLGSAGYKRDGESLTPGLDAFSKDATLFSRAYAQAPNTPRSFPSFFASKYPSQVKVDKSFANYSTVLDDNLTMWEVLRDQGFTTVGLSSHFYFKAERGIRQGFDEYDNEGAKNIAGSNKDIASPRTVPKAIAKLKELADKGDRFAMFVHLFEPHSTYLKHPEYPIKSRGTAGLEEKYDYEIKFVDVWISKLLAGLEASGVADDTLVVFASDHGEAFGVHRVDGKRMFFHGQTLYDELLRVPIIIKAPGGTAGVADEVVMMIDVAPTIIDLLGLPIPSSFVGRSLARRVFGEPLPEKPAFAELIKAPSWPRDAKAMVTGDGKYKAIYSITDGKWEIYDLSSDPTEVNDLSSRDKELTARLKEQLGRFIEVDLRAP